MVEPHTGDSGAGCAYTTLTYLYPGGPLTMVSQSDESNNLIRQYLTSYGKEGEVLVRSAWTGSGSNTVQVAAYQWDPLLRLQQVADGLNHATGYSYYSDTGYLQQITYPGGDDVEFPSYDPVGNPLQQIVRGNGTSVTTNYLYGDPDGQLSDIKPDGGPNIHIEYDQYDRRAAMTDGAGSSSTTYDDLDEPLSVTTTYNGVMPGTMLPPQILSYGYFPDGSRRTLTTPPALLQRATIGPRA